jgi:hypothetical protein
MATAFAVPIGSYLGAIIGWRGIFCARDGHRRPGAAQTSAAELEKVNVQLEWMLVPLFCNETGYNRKAVERKIQDGAGRPHHYQSARTLQVGTRKSDLTLAAGRSR